MPYISELELQELKEIKRWALSRIENNINPTLILNRIDPPEFQNLKNELSKYRKLFWKIYIKK